MRSISDDVALSRPRRRIEIVLRRAMGELQRRLGTRINGSCQLSSLPRISTPLHIQLGLEVSLPANLSDRDLQGFDNFLKTASQPSTRLAGCARRNRICDVTVSNNAAGSDTSSHACGDGVLRASRAQPRTTSDMSGAADSLDFAARADNQPGPTRAANYCSFECFGALDEAVNADAE